MPRRHFPGAFSVIVGSHLQAVVRSVELDPEILRSAVLRGVGDDLLNTAHDSVSLLRIGDLDIFRQLEMDLRARQPFDQGRQGLRQIDPTAAAQRADRKLIEEGWLQAEVIPIGRTRKTLLRLTPRAKQAVGAESDKSTRESIGHAYWKQYYADRFRKLGFKVAIEAPRTGGRVDVLATKNGQRVAIEIETGKSDVVANVRNDLRSGFKRVIVVATEKDALAKVERELAQAGLMIPGRVHVVMRDGFRMAG